MIETSQQAGQPIAAVIVARPGIMQQSLRASLAASPFVVVVASLGDGLSALNYAAAHKPGLLVIDCSLLDDEVDALLTGVRDLQLATRCLVLTRSHRQGTRVVAYGACAVLPRDGSFQELQAVLAQMNIGKPAQT